MNLGYLAEMEFVFRPVHCLRKPDYERFSAMTTLTEIETAIRQLPSSEVYQLISWLQAYADDFWDQQLESDLQSGRLDSLIAKAEADIAAHRIRDLDEVIHHA